MGWIKKHSSISVHDLYDRWQCYNCKTARRHLWKLFGKSQLSVVKKRMVVSCFGMIDRLVNGLRHDCWTNKMTIKKKHTSISNRENRFYTQHLDPLTITPLELCNKHPSIIQAYAHRAVVAVLWITFLLTACYTDNVKCCPWCKLQEKPNILLLQTCVQQQAMHSFLQCLHLSFYNLTFFFWC